MLNKLKNLIRLARISRAGDGGGQLPVQQVEYLGKLAESVIVFPFGMHANVDIDSLALMFSIQGNPESRAAIAMSPDRPTLEAGEIAIYHPKTGSIVKMKANGDIDMVAPNVNITGNLVVNGKDFLTHTHPQGNDSNGDTQVNTGPLL